MNYYFRVVCNKQSAVKRCELIMPICLLH